MPCRTTLTAAQLADLAHAERALAFSSGDRTALLACLGRLADSGLPGARVARRLVTRAGCLLDEAMDSLADDVRAAREVMDEVEPAPF